MRSTACHAFVVLAIVALTSACASSGRVRPIPQPFPSPAVEGAQDDPARYESLLDTALSLRGTPYLNGGTDPRGFDCSGFTQFVYGRHGVPLPREVRDQFTLGTPVDRDRLRPGDLIFFATVSDGPSHVGIAVGGGRFVHAPSSRGVVRVESVGVPYWSSRLVGIRRVTLP